MQNLRFDHIDERFVEWSEVVGWREPMMVVSVTSIIEKHVVSKKAGYLLGWCSDKSLNNVQGVSNGRNAAVASVLFIYLVIFFLSSHQV